MVWPFSRTSRRAPELESPRAATPLSAELFAQIKAIQIRTQRLVTDVLAGEYESAFKGRGMEFEKVREYQPGDDVRHIDWNVTARRRAPFVKEFREERELTVMLVVDVSSSGAFGSAKKLKSEVAAEIAAILAYTAIKSNDRVGLVIFTDRVEHYIPPKKGRAHVWRVIRDILTFTPERRHTNLDVALEYLNRVVHRRSVTFVISDFLDADFKDALLLTAQHHDVTAICVVDPRERELPPVGIIELEDAETGEVILVDTYDRNIAHGFSTLARSASRQRAETFRAAEVGHIEVRTDASYVDPIVRFFRSRERRKAS
jgi:uncharacterized protein (DUF58 family)